MILATFFIESFSSALDSPYIVPVAGCFMILGIVVAGIWSGNRNREMGSQERLAAIAKGITPPPTKEELAITLRLDLHHRPGARRPLRLRRRPHPPRHRRRPPHRRPPPDPRTGSLHLHVHLAHPLSKAISS
jgi:hypothetical protein